MNDLTFIAKLAKPRRGGFSLLILPIALLPFCVRLF